MIFKQGEKVFWRSIHGKTFYTAEVLSQDSEKFVLKLNESPGKALPAGQEVVVRSGDDDYFTQVLKFGHETLELKPLWAEQRRYFRVDDVFPVVSRKIDKSAPRRKARTFSGVGMEVAEVKVPEDVDSATARLLEKLSSVNSKLSLMLYALEMSDVSVPDEATNRQVLKMFDEVDTKLEVILQKLQIDGYRLMKAEHKHISVSAVGIRFTVNEKLEVGDVLEVKMLLPTSPPVGVVTTGDVVRVNALDDGRYEVAVDFSDMGDDVRDEIIHYALNRQREIIREKRRQWENNV
jgi:hypothetical protein